MLVLEAWAPAECIAGVYGLWVILLHINSRGCVGATSVFVRCMNLLFQFFSCSVSFIRTIHPGRLIIWCHLNQLSVHYLFHGLRRTRFCFNKDHTKCYVAFWRSWNSKLASIAKLVIWIKPVVWYQCPSLSIDMCTMVLPVYTENWMSLYRNSLYSLCSLSGKLKLFQNETKYFKKPSPQTVHLLYSK